MEDGAERPLAGWGVESKDEAAQLEPIRLAALGAGGEGRREAGRGN
jgi:hypothetical protein